MMRKNRDALECDLAETYNIYDIRALPARRVALFAVGLRDNSRIKMLLADSKFTFSEILLINIYDALNLELWTKTKDATKGKNKPESLYKKLMGINDQTKKESKNMTFDSAEEYEKIRKKLLERG